MNPGARVAHAVAVKDGKIVYVGSDEGVNAFVGPSTKVVKLGGKMMLPGFIDSHAHAGMTASAASTRCCSTASAASTSTSPRSTTSPTPTPTWTWVRGQGWSNTVVPDLGPLASDLDKVVPDRPVVHHVRGRPLLLGQHQGARGSPASPARRPTR